MSRRFIPCVVILALSLICLQARADWTPNTPNTKWVQMPDETPNGLDVKATVPKILADDFKCTFTGPITDVHIWGSWLNDRLPVVPGTNTPDPGAVTFKLSFHADVPADPAGGPSHPGQQLWSMVMPIGSFKVVPWNTNVSEGFYDPNIGQVIGKDTTIWQYNFNIPPTAAFTQQLGNIYWLDVQALPASTDSVFGWKTRNPDPTVFGGGHFGDDAVFGDVEFGGIPAAWTPLVYPPGHPFADHSIDLAFALTTVPEPASLGLLGAAAVILISRRRR